MDILRKQIARARRRLVWQSFAGKLAWCWFFSLLAAAVAIGVGRFWPPVADPLGWAVGCLAAGLGLGLLAAVIWTWARRQTAIEAAQEIDRRFALKERVASALSLGSEELSSDAGQALVRDTAQRIAKIDLADQFGVRPTRKALLPVAPALAVAALVLVGGMNVESQNTPAPAADSARIKKSTQSLVKKLDEQRKQAVEKGLPEADGLLKQIEAQAKTLAEKSQPDRKQTLVALNDLVKEAEKRRQQLASGAELKQQLNQLKNFQNGPADRLAAALKKGDIQKAKAELDKLQEKLSGDKLGEQERKDLANQLEQMQQSLQKMTEAHKQAQEALRDKIEAERKAGNVAEANKLQQQLDKLAEKAPQMDKLGQMAQQMKQAAEAMKNGDPKQAAAALSELSNNLESMQKEMQELETLESTLDELADAKNAMACKECNGEGCEACQGEGNRFGKKWGRSKNAKGGGIGAGEREESKTATGFYDTKVKQNVGKGASVVTGLADGPNRKGQVQEAIKSDFSNSEQQTAEALTDQRLPHDYREHAKKYFDTLRDGQK